MSVSAKKPLIGEMTLQFDLDWFNDPNFPNPNRPDWVGTIKFEGDDHVYGMAFFVYGSGKPFDLDPNPKVHFFKEKYEIYYTLEFEFDAETGYLTEFEPGERAIWGYDVGITTQNSKYHMNGNVEYADGDFSQWIGRNVYMSGEIKWYDNGLPKYAPGTVRIN
ncbi:MAG: hypothetical protein ACW964_12815, partial [Candidatus Hodarchaeales archaeon]|jgi:hypothetical protein